MEFTYSHDRDALLADIQGFVAGKGYKLKAELKRGYGGGKSGGAERYVLKSAYADTTLLSTIAKVPRKVLAASDFPLELSLTSKAGDELGIKLDCPRELQFTRGMTAAKAADGKVFSPERKPDGTQAAARIPVAVDLAAPAKFVLDCSAETAKPSPLSQLGLRARMSLNFDPRVFRWERKEVAVGIGENRHSEERRIYSAVAQRELLDHNGFEVGPHFDPRLSDVAYWSERYYPVGRHQRTAFQQEFVLPAGTVLVPAFEYYSVDAQARVSEPAIIMTLNVNTVGTTAPDGFLVYLAYVKE
jgi:hypothetical protein